MKYGCHNSPPAKLDRMVQHGWFELNGLVMPKLTKIPFTNSLDCQYTKSNLGQIDERCEGCKHRMKVNND